MDSILPGIFYWKISAPDSANRALLTIHDAENDEEMGDDGEPSWGAKMLRHGALALACYGGLVMVICLSMNILFPSSS